MLVYIHYTLTVVRRVYVEVQAVLALPLQHVPEVPQVGHPVGGQRAVLVYLVGEGLRAVNRLNSH